MSGPTSERSFTEDDLRAVLADHATAAGPGTPGSVLARGARDRAAAARRRTALVAGAAALAIAALAVGVLMPRLAGSSAPPGTRPLTPLPVADANASLVGLVTGTGNAPGKSAIDVPAGAGEIFVVTQCLGVSGAEPGLLVRPAARGELLTACQAARTRSSTPDALFARKGGTEAVTVQAQHVRGAWQVGVYAVDPRWDNKSVQAGPDMIGTRQFRYVQLGTTGNTATVPPLGGPRLTLRMVCSGAGHLSASIDGSQVATISCPPEEVLHEEYVDVPYDVAARVLRSTGADQTLRLTWSGDPAARGLVAYYTGPADDSASPTPQLTSAALRDALGRTATHGHDSHGGYVSQGLTAFCGYDVLGRSPDTRFLYVSFYCQEFTVKAGSLVPGDVATDAARVDQVSAEVVRPGGSTGDGNAAGLFPSQVYAQLYGPGPTVEAVRSARFAGEDAEAQALAAWTLLDGGAPTS